MLHDKKNQNKNVYSEKLTDKKKLHKRVRHTWLRYLFYLHMLLYSVMGQKGDHVTMNRKQICLEKKLSTCSKQKRTDKLSIKHTFQNVTNISGTCCQEGKHRKVVSIVDANQPICFYFRFQIVITDKTDSSI